MKHKKLIITISAIGLVLILALFAKPQVQMKGGLAVAESPIKWNHLKDAAVGDNLTSGLMASGLFFFDGTNWDRARGDITHGLDVDVTRVPGKTPGDAYPNPADHLGTWALTGIFDGTNWRRWLLSIHGDNLVTATGGNVASFSYLFDGTNWDRMRGDVSFGLDVDVTRVTGNISAIGTQADNTANVTTKLPVIAGRANAASPSWTEGNQVPISTDLVGRVRVRGATTPADDFANPATTVDSFSLLTGWDGANWDRLRTAPSPATVGIQPKTTAFLQNNVLLASAARTTSGSTAALPNYGSFRTAVIQVNVTAFSGTTPTLDVYIDTTVDGTTWINMARFTQVTGVARRAIQISENTAGVTTDFDVTVDLATGTVRQGPWGSDIRIRWVIGGGTPSFTFELRGTFKS